MSCKGREGYRNPVTWFALISLAGANLKILAFPVMFLGLQISSRERGELRKGELGKYKDAVITNEAVFDAESCQDTRSFLRFLSAFGSLVIFLDSCVNICDSCL